MTISTPPRVLLVEDNPGDVFLLQECLRERGAVIDLVVAGEVDEGIQLLASDQPPPCLALIDLHLPKQDGRHLLTYLKEQPHLTGLPAVVLSSSQRPADHQACLDLGAREVLVKPSDWAGYALLVGTLERYWSGPTARQGAAADG
jgi:CheY-like chemotaxis protein